MSGNLLLKFRDLSFELQSILIKGESDRTESEKNRSDELTVDLDYIRKEVQNFETSQVSIFENTAEAKARNRAILWWVMNLGYEKDGDNYNLICKGDGFEDRLIQYDNFEEDEDKYEFILGVIRRVTYLTTLWFLGRIDNTEDFILYDNSFLKENKIVVENNIVVENSDVSKKEVTSIIEEIKPE
jgi:hypothetical protein